MDESYVFENLNYMYNLNLNFKPYQDRSMKQNLALFNLEFYQKISLPLSVLFFIFLAFQWECILIENIPLFLNL